jgi:hypothetical protein
VVAIVRCHLCTEYPQQWGFFVCHTVAVMNKTVQELTDIELKAIAFEQQLARDSAQKNLEIIIAELQRRQTEPSKQNEPSKDKPKGKAVSK